MTTHVQRAAKAAARAKAAGSTAGAPGASTIGGALPVAARPVFVDRPRPQTQEYTATGQRLPQQTQLSMVYMAVVELFVKANRLPITLSAAELAGQTGLTAAEVSARSRSWSAEGSSPGNPRALAVLCVGSRPRCGPMTMARTTRRVIARGIWHIASALARVLGCGPLSCTPLQNGGSPVSVNREPDEPGSPVLLDPGLQNPGVGVRGARDPSQRSRSPAIALLHADKLG
jgi:hypothetical protein